MKTCKQCGIELTPERKQFCSKKCTQNYDYHNNPKRKESIINNIKSKRRAEFLEKVRLEELKKIEEHKKFIQIIEEGRRNI